MTPQSDLIEVYRKLARHQTSKPRPNDGSILSYKDYVGSLQELADADESVLRSLGQTELIDPNLLIRDDDGAAVAETASAFESVEASATQSARPRVGFFKGLFKFGK